MSNLPQAPDNMEDFMSKAKTYVEKSKSAGQDPISTAAGLQFMYGLTQQNITNKQAQTALEATTALQGQQGNLLAAQTGATNAGEWSQVPGTLDLINNRTGELKKNSLVAPSKDLSGGTGGSQNVPLPTSQTSGGSKQSALAGHFQSWSPTGQAAPQAAQVGTPNHMVNGTDLSGITNGSLHESGSTPSVSGSAQVSQQPTTGWQLPSWLQGFGAGSPKVPKLT